MLYTRAMKAAHGETKLVVACDVGVDGHTHECVIESLIGSAVFKDPTLRWLQSARYVPAMRNGVPVVERHHVYHFRFVTP